MTYRVIHQLRQFWKIKSGQKRETGLWHLVPSSLERLWLGNCNPSRFLVSTMALFRIVRPSSKLIHNGLVGRHSNRNVLMRVIKTSPTWSGPGLGVAQGVNPKDKGGFVMPNMLVRIGVEEVDVKDET